MSAPPPAVDGDVPRPFDKIQVLFTLEVSNEEYWWPSVVLSSKEKPGSTTVRGTGRIEYAARHSNKEEQEDVIFLPNRVVSTSHGDTPWRTATEAADVGAGDEGDRDWESEMQSRIDSRRKRPASIGHGRAEPASDEEENNIGDRPFSSKKKKKKRGSRRGPINRRVSESAPAARQQQDIEQSAVAELREEVEGIKARMTQELKSKMDEEVDRKNGEKLAIWRVRVQKMLASACRETRGGTARPFTAVMQTAALVVRDMVSYETFTQMVGSLVRDMDARQTKAVVFVPSLSELLDPKENISEGHVVFESARAMFKWLGMGSTCDVDGAVVKGRKLQSGLSILRVLGGMQWSGRIEDPMHIFVGRSCGVSEVTADRQTEETGARPSRDVNAIEFASARWDGSNNLMASQPTACSAFPGVYDEEKSYSDARHSLFSL